MSYKIGSGNKATLTLAESGVIGRFRMIGETAFEVGEENVSGLDTDEFEEFEPQDLATMSDTEIELFFNTKLVIMPEEAPASGAFLKLRHKELMTLTMPTRSDEDEPASLAAWGYFKKIGLPQMVNNTTMMLKATIKWCHRDEDGVAVKPVYTPAEATV
jgi:hypothetical protein